MQQHFLATILTAPPILTNSLSPSLPSFYPPSPILSISRFLKISHRNSLIHCYLCPVCSIVLFSHPSFAISLPNFLHFIDPQEWPLIRCDKNTLKKITTNRIFNPVTDCIAIDCSFTPFPSSSSSSQLQGGSLEIKTLSAAAATSALLHRRSEALLWKKFLVPLSATSAGLEVRKKKKSKI
jgi:hypothetical protein